MKKETLIGPLTAFGDDFIKYKPAYPTVFKFIIDDDETEVCHYPGMTLTDYFAAQYMSAGKLPDEAFRLARLAMKEREARV